MKRFLITICSLACCIPIRAGVVSPEEAQNVAAAFFDVAGVSICPGPDGTKTSLEEPAYYVFNNPAGGWVIVAGEDCMGPVLAYSLSGSFCSDGMPDNLRWWFEAVGEATASARKSGLKASASVRKAWSLRGLRKARTSDGSSGSAVYMETATWAQSSPYNFYCPDVTETSESDPAGKTYKSLTGCEPTAMAIVMHYNRYPEHGTGTLPDYTYTSDFKIPMEIKGFDISSHNYNYDLMPSTDEEMQNAGSTAQQQVARLIYDAGVAVKAQYNYSTGTAAYTGFVTAALSEYFGYDASARSLDRSSYSLGGWIDMLKEEMDSMRPVLYAAVGSMGGHMFVIAGYDESDLFYVNWGWAGINNGYYSIKDLYIDESISFKYDHTAYTNLKADQGGKRESSIVLSGTGITVTSGTPEQGSDFKISAQYFCNEDYYDYNGSVRAALVDFRDSLRCYIGPETEMNITGMGESQVIHNMSLEDYTCNIPEQMNFGDGLAFFYKTGDDIWKLVPYNHEGFKLTRYGVYDACAIDLPENIMAGDVLAPSIVPGQRVISSIDWFLDEVQITTGQTSPLAAGAHTIKASVYFRDGSSENIIREINVE